MRTDQELIDKIRGRGAKVTPQRLAIYRALEGDTTHPTAEAVYERVRASMPTTSLATVYKTLNEMVAGGELRRFEVRGVSHFDPHVDPHAEAVCLRCAHIVDVTPEVSGPGPASAPPVPGFQIVGQTLTYYGYCDRCAADRAPRGENDGGTGFAPS